MGFWSKIDFFEPWEWKDDPEKSSKTLIIALNRARMMTFSQKFPNGIPIHIHVCYEESGHAENSYHYSGEAVDFHFSPGTDCWHELIILAAQPEFGAIGFYPNWSPRPGWHVDIRKRKSKLYWSYTNGEYRYGPFAL